ncbi:MAG: class I tRNA ligase family protein, partial [Archaeoglobaceae archaeon]
KEVREAMDKLQTRRAVNFAFFEIMDDVRWYLRRGGKNLALILDDWIKLLAPFAPHICEELWHLKHESFVSLENYPEFEESKIDEKAEKAEEFIARLLEDIKEVKKFVENAKEVRIYVAEDWKYEALKIALERGLSEALKEMSKRGVEKSEIANFAKRFKSAELIENERELIKESIEFFERETQLKVSLSSDVPEEKKKSAMPGKPAIYVC